MNPILASLASKRSNHIILHTNAKNMKIKKIIVFFFPSTIFTNIRDFRHFWQFFANCRDNFAIKIKICFDQLKKKPGKFGPYTLPIAVLVDNHIATSSSWKSLNDVTPFHELNDFVTSVDTSIKNTYDVICRRSLSLH